MQNPQPEKSWLADVNWKTAVIYIALSVIAGGSTGAGVVATKAVQAQGLSQDQADVRYLTKDEAVRRADVDDKQLEEIKKNMVRNDVFDERTTTILKNLDQQRQERKEDREYFERLILNLK